MFHLLHPDRGKKCENGHEQGQIQGKSQGHGLGHGNIQPDPASSVLHQDRVVHRRPDDHHRNVSNGLDPHLHFQHPPPVIGVACAFQSVIGQGLIGSAGAGLRRAAENPVEQEDPKQPPGIVSGGKAEQRHLCNHERSGKHQQILSPQGVCQCPRGDLKEHDGHRPDHVQKRKLGQRQTKIEEQNGEHRIVESGIEKGPKGNKPAHIANGKRRLFDKFLLIEYRTRNREC